MSAIREKNLAAAIKAVAEMGPLSRADLAAALGVTRSTSSSIVAELIELGLVRETFLENSTGGRPGMMVEKRPEGALAVGVAVDVDAVAVSLADFSGSVLFEKRAPIDIDARPARTIAKAERMTKAAMEKAEQISGLPVGIGVGLPGLVKRSAGVLAFAPNLGWRDVPLRDRWREKFGLPVHVENEANAAAMGEYLLGAARGSACFVYLSVGVGIGGAMVVGGRLFGGAGGFAGEVGHMAVDPKGPLCGCGRKGCLETVASTAAVERLAAAAIAPSNSRPLAKSGKKRKETGFRQVIAAAEAGDKAALRAFAKTGALLGQGVASLINIVNPELVVIGGPMARAAEYIMPAVEKAALDNCLDETRAGAKVVASALGGDACAIGAAAIVLDLAMRNPASIRR